MYFMFILNLQEVKTKCQILLKRVKTSVILIVFNGVLYHIHAYTVTASQGFLQQFNLMGAKDISKNFGVSHATNTKI